MISLENDCVFENFQGHISLNFLVKFDENDFLGLIGQVSFNQRNRIFNLCNRKLSLIETFSPVNVRKINSLFQLEMFLTFLLGKIMDF